MDCGCFIFSSRRRHTRFDCDWSSDVCSSDLNMSFLNNVVRNLGTSVNTGQIHGQGLSGAYAQRIADGQPLYAFYMRTFAGFDANGLGIYANNEQLSFVGSPIPTMTLGLTNTLTLGRLDFSAFLEGAFGH